MKKVIQQRQQAMIDDEQMNTDPNTQLIESQKQIQKDLQLKHEQTLFKEREEKIRQVEDDILDVHYIMNELASMVSAQSEPISMFFVFFLN